MIGSGHSLVVVLGQSQVAQLIVLPFIRHPKSRRSAHRVLAARSPQNSAFLQSRRLSVHTIQLSDSAVYVLVSTRTLYPPSGLTMLPSPRRHMHRPQRIPDTRQHHCTSAGCGHSIRIQDTTYCTYSDLWADCLATSQYYE